MYFFGLFPWECLTCQEKFFNRVRHARSSNRHPLGEVYTGTTPAPSVKPGSEESRS